MMRHKKPSHNQRRQANKVAKLKVQNETPRKTKSANTSKSTPASERKTKYRIPKISKQAKVESNPIPSELASILKDLQKCRPVLKDYSPATNALITRVVQEEHTDSSDDDDQDSDWEVEEEKANSKLSLENVTLAAVAEFSNLEDALHNLVDTDELVKVMALLCNRVNSILPGPIVEQMSQTADISFIYIHLFKELKQVAPEMRLILYPVLFCYLATTVFNTADSQELFIWPQLMAEYDRFLQIFSGEIKPLHLLASIHTSFQQIFEKSKSMEEMTSLYGKVMPLYNSIFMHVLKGREMQFSEIDVDVFGCILFDLFGFNSLFSCVDNQQKYNIIDTTSEDITTGQVFHMIFSCCGENASSVFDTFTSSLYQYLSAKPLEIALQRWLELVKSLSSPLSHLFPHIFFLAAKQIGSHIGRARKRPLKNTLATYSSVKKQLKRIAAHLKRTPISSGSVNEANYLIAMLYYAPSVLHLRHDDLASLANWFNDTLDQAMSRQNKMILAQLTPEKLVLVGVNGQIVEDDEYGSV